MNNFIRKIFVLLISLFVLSSSSDLLFANINNDTNQKNIEGIINKTILSYSKVTDSYAGAEDSVIVWIQDLHNDFSTQKNILNILT